MLRKVDRIVLRVPNLLSAVAYYRDVMGKLDPQTGKVIEYPMPYADNGMRDFFVDREGRMWFGSPPNNRVGYFYLSNRQRSAEAR